MSRSTLLAIAFTGLVTAAFTSMLPHSTAIAQSPSSGRYGTDSYVPPGARPAEPKIERPKVERPIVPTGLPANYMEPLSQFVGRDVVIELKDDKQVQGQLMSSSITFATVRTPSPSGFASTAFPESVTGGEPVEVWVPMMEVRYIIARSPGAKP